MIIVHLIKAAEWEEIGHDASLLGRDAGQDEFLHCCLPEQITTVLDQWFSGQTNIIALEIETEKLISSVLFENLEGGEEQFPHIYGGVNQAAVAGWYAIN